MERISCQSIPKCCKDFHYVGNKMMTSLLYKLPPCPKIMKTQKKPEFEPSQPPEIIPEPDTPEKLPEKEPEKLPEEPPTKKPYEPDTPFPDPRERPRSKG